MSRTQIEVDGLCEKWMSCDLNKFSGISIEHLYQAFHAAYRIGYSDACLDQLCAQAQELGMGYDK